MKFHNFLFFYSKLGELSKKCSEEFATYKPQKLCVDFLEPGPTDEFVKKCLENCSKKEKREKCQIEDIYENGKLDWKELKESFLKLVDPNKVSQSTAVDDSIEFCQPIGKS